MDLISKEELKDYLEKNISFGGTEKKFRFYDMIDSLPSAFEGMTFGEIFKSVFAEYIGGVYVGKDYVEVAFNDIKTHISYFPNELWDSPYKEVSK